MKILLVLLLLIIGAVGYLVFGPSGDKGVPAQEKGTTSSTSVTANGGTTEGGKASQSSSSTAAASKEPAAATDSAADGRVQRMAGATGIVGEMAAAGSYATGYTQVMIKNRTSKKIDKLNKQHNDQLNELLH